MKQEISKLDDPSETPDFNNPEWVAKMEKVNAEIDNSKE